MLKGRDGGRRHTGKNENVQITGQKPRCGETVFDKDIKA
jgi:hypothetical protein